MDMKKHNSFDYKAAGITRGFMAKKCDMYFTMEDKLRRFLKCCFTLYKVPEEKQEKIIADTVKKAEEGFESVLNDI